MRTRPSSDSRRTSQPVAGCANRNVIRSPVHRTPTCPPVTDRTSSTGVAAGGGPADGPTDGPTDGLIGGGGLTAAGLAPDAPGTDRDARPSTSLPALPIANQAAADVAVTTPTQARTASSTVRFGRRRGPPGSLGSGIELFSHPVDGYGLSMASILLVEDDAAIRSAVTRALTARGHAVDSRPTGMAGLQAAIDDHPDVVLLDLGLPDTDGLHVLSMLRAVSAVPVIVVTARDDGDAVVKALDAGADDYVIKPFDVIQVDARLRAVLRRSGSDPAEAPLSVGGLIIDPAAREVVLDAARIELSRKEFDILYVLASNLGRVVTKRELLAQVWRQPYGGAERTVDVHLSWLRRKLGESAAQPRYLHSVRGVGVRLVDPDS
jgi:DNA-binding response OmpR family regulator